MVDTQHAPDVMSAACPSRPTLQHLTGRWGALTMAALAHGTQRFSEIRRRIEGVQAGRRLTVHGRIGRRGSSERILYNPRYELDS